ncbi:MAG: VCBS repeat-containing protein, partial [Planctomycetota bacterium]
MPVITLVALALVQLEAAQPVIGNPTSPAEVLFADVDADGRLDVVVQSFSTAGVRVALGEASGAFGPLRPLVTGTPPPPNHRGRSLAAADIDLDGDVDLVLGSFEGKVTLVRSDGIGGAETIEEIDDLEGRTTSIHVGDLTGDGLPDVVVGTYESQQSSLYRQLPGGGFAAGESLVMGAAVEAAVLKFADLDGDGDLDALAAGASVTGSGIGTDGLLLFRNVSGVPFLPADVTRIRAGMNDVDVGDIDGDGDVDIVAARSELNRDALVFTNDGTGAFGAPSVLATAARFLRELRLADVDADGDLDVVVRRELQANRDSVGLFLNEGSGVWSEQAEPMLDSDIRAFDVVDLDGDGAVDLATGRASTSIDYSFAEIPVSLGRSVAGNRIFERKQELIARHATQPVLPMDANGDGRQDLLVVDSDAGSTSNGKVACRLALPGGGFGRPLPILETGFFSIPPTAGDYDGDGNVDVAAVALGAVDVQVSLGSGGGTFGAPIAALGPLAGSPSSVQTADLDADSRDDLILLTGSSTRVLFAFGQPSGSPQGPFSGLSGLPDGAFSQAVACRPDDLDGDGLIDLIYAAGDEIVWSRNVGGGSFACKATAAVFPVAAVYELPVPQVADVDGDGQADLVVVGAQADLLWARGLGGGVFAQPTGLALPAGALVKALVLDVDADGDGDIVADVGSAAGQRNLLLAENLGAAGFVPWTQLLASPFLGAVSLVPIDEGADGDLDVLIGGEDAWFRLARNARSSDLGERYCVPAVPNST